MKEKAVELFNQGYSCSESVIRAAHELGFVDKQLDIETLTQVSSTFSGGMGSGCLCGAVAGSQITLGCIFGRKDLNISPQNTKAIAKTFIQKFKDKRKATCCRVLTAGVGFNSPERRNNCVSIVADAAEILESHIKENLKESSGIC